MSVTLRVALALGPRFELDVDVRAEAPRVALFGPSGAGKSSLLSAAAGLVRPRAGRIQLGQTVVFDSDTGVDVPPERRRVGYVPQDSLLFPLSTVRENLGFARPAAPALSLAEVAEALAIDDLLDRRPMFLSGGERQRVALGRAVLSEPAALLCDEPFSALDRARRDALVDTLEGWRARLGIPLVFVTHQRDEVEALADHVAVVHGGRVVAQGGPRDVSQHL